MKDRLSRYLRSQIPSREQLEKNRLVAPLARRPELWRLTRRSVPRGVAIGLLIGILALIPGVQMIGAALLCVPCRGNIPLAAGLTFLSNPASTPFLLAAALWVGHALGFHSDIATFSALIENGAPLSAWMRWLLSDAAPGLVTGLFVISVFTAAVGYLLSVWIWRGLVARKRQRRTSQSGLTVPGQLNPAE